MTPSRYSEGELVEEPALRLLQQLGWEIVDGFDETLGVDGTLGRDTQAEPILRHRLRPALVDLNPGLPTDAIDEAVDVLMEDRSARGALRANRELWQLLRDGVRVQFSRDDGEEDTQRVKVIDWWDSTNNTYLAVSQCWFVGELHKRRADTVLFVNGIPFVFIEHKASHRRIEDAYNDNLRDYRDTIPHVFVPNAFVILSNGSDTKVGATYAPWEHFHDWKRIDSEGEVGIISLETALRGTCDPYRLLDLVENFVAYQEQPGGLIKLFAQNHQYLGVNAAMAALQEIETSEGRLGVFWHTQGAGKTMSMLWFSQKVLRREPGNWTFVMVSDEIDLGDQLHGEFADAGVLSGPPVKAESSKDLRQLLTEDHRYVFTLIHKFRPEKGQAMPVCSDRRDVVVITDEAHRTQYDLLAMNMRIALPNASYLGFTGTPLIAGEEERTREVFGDYISIYDFRASIEDGATVPLFYENRIPELQIINENFDEELTEILEEADLDDTAETRLARKFATTYQLITRPQRLVRIAADLVRHFVGRGFWGKAMVVSIDKATTVRMYDLVRAEWERYLDELRAERDGLPAPERAPINEQIEFMETTDMAVVVSQSQNELADLDAQGLDIRPHRRRMIDEELDDKFKDATDPLRIAFVCAMWRTGFDAPACSTIYLDRPMRNHTLMQTIARANRVFPNKDNGLVVDYAGVFRDLERALAVYGAGRPGSSIQFAVRDKSELIEELGDAVRDAVELCERYDVDLDALADANGFEYIALRDHAVEALLVDEEVRRSFLAVANWCRRIFTALLPDPAARDHTRVVGVLRNLAEKISSLDPPPDLGPITSAVGELLDRSVGAEEYVIRAVAEGSEPEPVIDLSTIDFEALAARFAGRARWSTRGLLHNLGQQIETAIAQNPSRRDLAERLRTLIDEYNAGSLNTEEVLRRLQALSSTLSDEQRRVVTEDMSEAELAVFDLLTKPAPELSDADLTSVRRAARSLMDNVQERLVLDWRRKADARAAVRTTIREVLDHDLPEVYDPELYETKCDVVFEHIFAAFYDDGRSVYDAPIELSGPGSAPAPSVAVDVEQLTDDLIERIRTDTAFAELMARQLRDEVATWAIPTPALLGGAETDQVEFKSTARWNLQDQAKDKRMEDAVVKTVAGCLNADGGTLLIGVDDGGTVLGLVADYECVKPSNGDGFVNWLTTHLANAIGHAAAMRTRIRIDTIEALDVCRVDVARSSVPVIARTSRAETVYFVRMHNSTREMPEDEWERYRLDRWGDE